ncbi:MAG TPA: GAF domain-containing protein, partial [Vicinamibacterales bacterium]|nr:GAF domain-containing protein [Vicinamibacterales bacterium]
DGSAVRGSVVVGLRRAVDERGRDAKDPAWVPPPVRRGARALIDERVARIVTADACLFAINPAGNALLVAHATSGLRDSVAGLELPVGGGVSGWVAANRSTIRTADPTLDVGELAEDLAFRCCTSTPVFTGGDLFGVLTVYGTQAAGFSESAVVAVGLLAQEVGLMMAQPERDEDVKFIAASGLSMAAAS